jgi:uncharacterized protein (DUF488 family)
MKLYTLGHNAHPIEKFLGLLAAHGIRRLVDVRSAPYSRFQPQFNKSRLDGALLLQGLEYTFAGEALGGRPADPTCFRVQMAMLAAGDLPRSVDYVEVMKREWFRQGIGRLLELAAGEATAILCSEEDPAKCHRHHLIARYLKDAHPQVEVLHIRGDGSLLPAASLWDRGNGTGRKQLSLF